jgi:hypothetical protein
LRQPFSNRLGESESPRCCVFSAKVMNEPPRHSRRLSHISSRGPGRGEAPLHVLAASPPFGAAPCVRQPAGRQAGGPPSRGMLREGETAPVSGGESALRERLQSAAFAERLNAAEVEFFMKPMWARFTHQLPYKSGGQGQSEVAWGVRPSLRSGCFARGSASRSIPEGNVPRWPAALLARRQSTARRTPETSDGRRARAARRPRPRFAQGQQYSAGATFVSLVATLWAASSAVA